MEFTSTSDERVKVLVKFYVNKVDRIWMILSRKSSTARGRKQSLSKYKGAVTKELSLEYS